MKALLVCPENPSSSYWSFSRALPYVQRRAAHPPLGLLTVAAQLPADWDLRLVDMNVTALTEAELRWADVVLASAMIVQEPALHRLAARCKHADVPLVAGGPLPSSSPQRLPDVDHLFLGEAEGNLAALVTDLEQGRAEARYEAGTAPDMERTRVPRFDLLDLDAYASMALQQSRGCPFRCEFCDIWRLYGRRPRVKSPLQLRAELDALFSAGWRGSVFFVDDNFVGDPRQARRSLEEIANWQLSHHFPFELYTEASVKSAADAELLQAFCDAGFSMLFLGIETPSTASLRGAHKEQNVGIGLLESVDRIQAQGIAVSAGFIVGFDQDGEEVFDRQFEFIQQAGIPMAMVGILTALEGTDLHERLRQENRLCGESNGDNTHRFEVDFVPRMPREQLLDGYRNLLRRLYGARLTSYFTRCRRLFDRLGRRRQPGRRAGRRELGALLRSLRVILTRRYGLAYLRFLAWTLLRHPRCLTDAVRLGIYGFHFEAITREALICDELLRDGERHVATCREALASWSTVRQSGSPTANHDLDKAITTRRKALRNARHTVTRQRPDLRAAAVQAYDELLRALDSAFAEHGATTAARVSATVGTVRAIRDRLSTEIERLHERYRRMVEEAVSGRDLLRRMARHGRAGRQMLRHARRGLRSVPQDYRLVWRQEIESLRRRFEELTRRRGGLRPWSGPSPAAG